MQRAKTFLFLVVVHLGLTLGAVHLAVNAFAAGLSGQGAVLADAAGHLAETALWALGSPVLTATWMVAPGFWSTGQLVALAALNSTAWVGAAVVLARWFHPRRPRLVSGLHPPA